MQNPNYKNAGAIYVPVPNTDHDRRDPWAGYEPTDEDIEESNAAWRDYQKMLRAAGDEGF
jgi:hypothetical protein